MPFFLEHRSTLRINMICVDEAHSACLTSSDYRASYSLIPNCIKLISEIQETTPLDIKKLDLPETHSKLIRYNLEKLPAKPRILLLTATANLSVKDNICQKFGIEKYFPPEKIFQRNFSLHFQRVVNPNTALLNIIRETFNYKFPVIIFCSFKKSTETLTVYLQQNGYKAYCFHGGLSELQKMNTLKELEKLEKTKKGKTPQTPYNLRLQKPIGSSARFVQNRCDHIDCVAFDGSGLLQVERSSSLQFALFRRILCAADWTIGAVGSAIDVYYFS